MVAMVAMVVKPTAMVAALAMVAVVLSGVVALGW